MDIVCCVMLAQHHRAVSTDHLGNVRVTVSDMLIPRGGVFDADLRTLTDYYPFGMTMPERSYEAAGIDGHRYGYNGKENDNEVKGEGNQQDYGFRIYDPRVARFLSVDPLAREYPGLTLYQFSSNTPIWAVDRDGLEARVYTETRQTGHSFITLGTGEGLVLYSYGRYLDNDPDSRLGGAVGNGVLLRFTGAVARQYLSTQLYTNEARAFQINDANETKLRTLFQKLWDDGKPIAPTETDKPNVLNLGRKINVYDLVSFNCTTIVCDALKLTGSKVFDEEALWGLFKFDQDFVIPSSLQNFLVNKSESSSQVGEVTSGVKKGISADLAKPAGTAGVANQSSGVSGDAVGSSANSSGGSGNSGNNVGSSSRDVD